MNFIDLLGAGVMGLGFWRGRKRGAGLELYRLINLGIPLIAGCGLFKLVSKVLTFIPGLNPDNAGLPGFLLVIGGAFFLMRAGRKKLRATLQDKFDDSGGSLAGGFIGLARSGILVLGVITGLVLSKANFLGKVLTEDSFLGRIISALAGA